MDIILFIQYSRKGKTVGTEYRLVVARNRAHWIGLITKRQRGIPWVPKLFSILTVVVDTQIYEFVKTHRIICPKMNFIEFF